MKICGQICWLVLLAATSAIEAFGQPPVFIHRLRVPVAQDDIGYGEAVTVDALTGETFVSDPRTNRILIFDRDGYFSFQILGGEQFNSPHDLAVDPDGLLLVLATRGRRGPLLLELDFDGEFRREVPLKGLAPDVEPPRLVSVAVSRSGDRIYLADDANRSLWITDRDGVVKRRVDLGADLDEDRRRDLFLGRVDVYGDYVLVARTSEAEILRFDLDGNSVDRVGLPGTAQCKLGRPTAAALTERGEFLIIDQQRMLLSHWRSADNRCLGEYIGIGAAPGYLYYPFDLALDEMGRAYIAQSFEGRVQVYEGMDPAATPTTPFGEEPPEGGGP